MYGMYLFLCVTRALFLSLSLCDARALSVSISLSLPPHTHSLSRSLALSIHRRDDADSRTRHHLVVPASWYVDVHAVGCFACARVCVRVCWHYEYLVCHTHYEYLVWFTRCIMTV